MKMLFALIAAAILLFGCAAQPAAEQKAPEQKSLPPPVQQQKPATPQQPGTNGQQTPPQSGTQPPSEQNQTNASAAGQPPSADELLSNPSLAGSPNRREKSTNIQGCCSHPYYHKVYRAFSSDGINWQKEGVLIKDHASVPAIMQRDDGSFVLYYVDGEYDTVDCSVSQDGSSFTDGNCRIYGFAEDRAWDPYAVRLENGNYRLFFFTPAMDLGADNVIRSATSKDGINFVEDPGIRFTHAQIYDPAVIRMADGTWRLFAGYNPESSPGSFPAPKIVSATSSDGITFTKESVLDIGGNVPEIVRLDSGQYALYYCGMGGIAMSTSSDGVSWSPGSTALPADQGRITCDPSITKMKDGRWVMYYKVQEMMKPY